MLSLFSPLKVPVSIVLIWFPSRARFSKFERPLNVLEVIVVMLFPPKSIDFTDPRPENVLPAWSDRSRTGLASVTALLLRSRVVRLAKAEKRPVASSVIWLLASDSDVVVVANAASAPVVREPMMARLEQSTVVPEHAHRVQSSGLHSASLGPLYFPAAHAVHAKEVRG